MMIEKDNEESYMVQFIDDLKRAYNGYKRKCGKVAFYMIDICDFNVYNYVFGYDESDKLLNDFFKRLNNILKEKAYLTKFTGDKFLAIAAFVDEIDIIKIEKHISRICEEKFILNGQEVSIKIKVGISFQEIKEDNVMLNLKYSDIALNYVKKYSRSEYVFFEQYMYDKALRKQKVSSEITNALENDELQLFYQPQIDIRSMKVYGLEALIRWNHPKLGILSPAYFIDVIENNGMINDVGKFVLYESCRQMKRWHTLGYTDLYISINIAESQFYDNNFLDFVKLVISKIQIETKYIIFEITERVIVELNKSKVNLINEIRKLGIRIFIDDFGIEYSALNYLYNLPVDGIKIDKCFIDNIQNSKKDLIITKTIIGLAHELNLDVIAEGVEKEEQLDCISHMQCNKVQGFIFQRPICSTEIDTFLKKFNLSS